MVTNMNFLWDIALRAESQGIEEREMFFRQAKEYSPFSEQAFSCLNEREVPDGEIELNLLYRFTHIFQEILSEDGEDYPEFGRYLVDGALHMLLYTDLRRGLTKRDIYVRRVMEELEDGTFWREAAEDFKLIPREKRNRLATLVLGQMETGSSLMAFRRGLLVLFPNAILYQVRADRKKLLLYLKENETEKNQRMLRFIQDMFLPVSYNLRVFWKYHFGIIGVDGAMKIDEIAIY